MAVVEVEEHGRIIQVTLNRPSKRNALTAEINSQLRRAFERFRDDSDLWIAVLAGEGPDFCVGVDLSQPPPRGRTQTWPGGITRDFECWKPVLAATQGHVLGGGLELALRADIRVGDPSTQLGAPEVKWGMMQGAGATQRLPRSAPSAVALEMLFTGDFVDAERAERIGLLNHVAEPGRRSIPQWQSPSGSLHAPLWGYVGRKKRRTEVGTSPSLTVFVSRCCSAACWLGLMISTRGVARSAIGATRFGSGGSETWQPSWRLRAGARICLI